MNNQSKEYRDNVRVGILRMIGVESGDLHTVSILRHRIEAALTNCDPLGLTAYLSAISIVDPNVDAMLSSMSQFEEIRDEGTIASLDFLVGLQMLMSGEKVVDLYQWLDTLRKAYNGLIEYAELVEGGITEKLIDICFALAGGENCEECHTRNECPLCNHNIDSDEAMGLVKHLVDLSYRICIESGFDAPYTPDDFLADYADLPVSMKLVQAVKTLMVAYVHEPVPDRGEELLNFWSEDRNMRFIGDKIRASIKRGYAGYFIDGDLIQRLKDYQEQRMGQEKIKSSVVAETRLVPSGLGTSMMVYKPERLNPKHLRN